MKAEGRRQISGVVATLIIVDRQVQHAVGRHRDARLIADAEWLAIANAANRPKRRTMILNACSTCAGSVTSEGSSWTGDQLLMVRRARASSSASRAISPHRRAPRRQLAGEHQAKASRTAGDDHDLVVERVTAAIPRCDGIADRGRCEAE